MNKSAEAKTAGAPAYSGGSIVRVIACCALLLGSASAACAQDSGPLTLKTAVALALKNSRELALARVQYTIAKNTTRLAHSAFLPNIFTGATPVYSNGFPATPGGAAPAVFKVVYTESVYNPELKGEQRADEDRARSQQLEIERTRDTVILNTASTYLELAKVRHALELLHTEEASAQKILDYVRERAGAGLELPIEVTRGELTVARIHHHALLLDDRNVVLTEQLRTEVGYPEGAAIEVAPEDLPATAEESAAALESVALENSIDLKEQENERSARQHLLKGAKESYWPTVQVIGEYDLLSKINNYQKFFSAFQRNNVNVGFQVTIPLFAAKTAATVALAKSELAAAELDVGAKRNDVRLEVRQQARNVHELESAREVARLDLKLTQESLGITQERFDQGRASLAELEQIRVEESEKWVTFLDADFARQQGQLSLLQTTGQLSNLFQ
ncbi:MAG TPA: TolC family protein [Candidatus Acidoferrales bacterium]|nr:TolC family protein [Candidatus Acidoferrales bacterium]